MTLLSVAVHKNNLNIRIYEIYNINTAGAITVHSKKNKTVEKRKFLPVSDKLVFAELVLDSFNTFPPLWHKCIERLWNKRFGGCFSKKCSVIKALFRAQ